MKCPKNKEKQKIGSRKVGFEVMTPTPPPTRKSVATPLPKETKKGKQENDTKVTQDNARMITNTKKNEQRYER